MKRVLSAVLASVFLLTSAFFVVTPKAYATVSSTNSKNVYNGDGSTTQWNYTFPIILSSDIQIYTVDVNGNTTQVTTNYSINTSLSQVTYPVTGTPLAIGTQIILLRVEPLTQGTSLKNQYRLPLDVIETSLDKLTMIAQQLQTSLNQTIQQSLVSSTPISLPDPITGDILAWGPTGNLVNVANPSLTAQWSTSGLNISYNAGNVSTINNFSAGSLNVTNNVGIGTLSPAAKLDVAGTVRSTAFTQTGTNPDTFTGTLTLNNSPNALLVPTGNVGIGSSTPGAALDVVGTIRGTSFIGAIPSGVIMIWSGTIATIPSGWVLCNGSNGTPDLRNMFIVGADADVSGVAKSTVSGSAAQTGGAATHTHTQGSLVVPDIQAGSARGASVPYATETYAVDDNSGGSDSDTHRLQNVPVSGTTDPASSLPPYYALAYIMKT